MRATPLSTVLALALAAGWPVAAASQEHEHAAAAAPAAAPAGEPEPLYDDLGTLHKKVTTTSPQAQRYFDQGLRLTYAFNHDEAIRSFTEGTKLDPGCAMCWWGIAYGLGPNINLPMDTSLVRPAWDAVQQAVQAAGGATPAERAYIEALAKRYGPEPVADRAPLDSAYTDAMREVAKKYPGDPDAQALYAESIMDLSPWHYWTDRGTVARPGTDIVVATLERTIRSAPNHPGACHFYIHIVEASTTPARAVPCAQRLAQLMPGAGHLVHMPSHIWMRTGRYDLVVSHNHDATAQDEKFVADRQPTGAYRFGYYPHNYHMLYGGLSFLGRADEAIAAARKTAAIEPVEVARAVPVLEYFIPVPYFALARFGRWDEILAEPAPAAELRYTTGIWRYARALALTGKARFPEARVEQDSLLAIIAATSPEQIVNFNSAKTMLQLAERHLAGRMAVAHADLPAAVAAYQEAMALEDGLVYEEPPAWYVPIREELGRAYFDAGQYAESEKAFRDDLSYWRDNPWSMRGLARSLRRQGRNPEAAELEKKLAQETPG